MISYIYRPHYGDHLASVARLVTADVALTASYADVTRARKGRLPIVRMHHGAGQSYGDGKPNYAGGDDHDDVGLFLVPNDHAGARWHARYPAARVEVVGSPRLDDLPQRIPDGQTTVAVTFHWHSGGNERGNAFGHWRAVLPELARRFHVIGHGHPRNTDLPRFWKNHGIEHVPDFLDVCRRADVLLFDNTSAGFEFASTGRPVVVLNQPEYRRDIEIGLRFWSASHVGLNVWPGDDLPTAVAEALEDAPERKAAREDALGIVYAYRTGAAQRAAAAIEDWAA